MTTENSSTFNLEVPPYTEVTIDYTMDEVVMQQTTEFTANLDYDIIIHSHGSFIHHFDSTKHMESIFQGLCEIDVVRLPELYMQIFQLNTIIWMPLHLQLDLLFKSLVNTQEQLMLNTIFKSGRCVTVTKM